MIRLTGYRLALFRKKFGRLPTVNDELFFDETQARPVRASPGAIRDQILAASEAQGLNSPMLLSYLGLDPAVARDREAPRAGSAVLDRAESDGRGDVAYRTDMPADIRRSRQIASIASKRRVIGQVIGNVGRAARLTRRPGEPHPGRRPLQSLLAEATRGRAGARGGDLRSALVAGSLDDSRKVSTSSRRNRLIRPIA
jgi:hypothetical protein